MKSTDPLTGVGANSQAVIALGVVPNYVSDQEHRVSVVSDPDHRTVCYRRDQASKEIIGFCVREGTGKMGERGCASRGGGEGGGGYRYNRSFIELFTSRVNTTRRVFCCMVMTEGGKAP